MPDQTTTPDPAPAMDVATARDLLLHPGGYARSLLALAADVLVRDYDRLQARVLTVLKADDADPVAAAEFTRQAADRFASELARLRPVVDAACAWKVKRDQLGYPRPWSPAPDGSYIPEARALYDAVAGLDGDAAATPQPAPATGWVHEDGTPCPEFQADRPFESPGVQWRCDVRQQRVHRDPSAAADTTPGGDR